MRVTSLADPVIKQGPDMKHTNLGVGEGPTSCSPDVTTNITNYRRWNPLNLIKDWIVVGLFVTVLVIDQVSKLVVKSNLTLYESWPEQGFLRITHGTNTGTAFGLLPNQTTFLIVASIVAIGFIIYFYGSQDKPNFPIRAAIGLQLGGAFGNLIDRLWAGAVVDFIDVGPWPIFNLADSSIVVGITILIAAFTFSRDGEKPANVEESSADVVGLQDRPPSSKHE